MMVSYMTAYDALRQQRAITNISIEAEKEQKEWLNKWQRASLAAVCILGIISIIGGIILCL